MRRYLLPLVVVALTAAVLIWAWSRLTVHKTRDTAVHTAPLAYDGSQPLRLAVLPGDGDESTARVHAWLRDELDDWLAHASEMRYDRGTVSHQTAVFTLQALVATPTQLRLRLIAPDGAIAREQQLALQEIGLPLALQLAQQVPRFLRLQSDWQPLIGTRDAQRYDTVIRAREHLRAAPPERLASEPTEQREVSDIDALERVTHQEKRYARAWSTLALAYARMKGEDSTSLDTLALNAAERAIALDPVAAEAQAVRGHVQYRRGQWLAAHEQLLHALQLQPDEPIALSALACLLADAGLGAQALPIAQRAAKVAPLSGAARECLSYARASMHQPLIERSDAPLPFAAARVVATVQILDGDLAAARQTYEAALAREHRHAPWLEALLNATDDRQQTVSALRAITSAGSEKLVDPGTELLAGIALQRSDFVFNRLLRLQHTNEYAPLRVLWLPQVKNLRKHARFNDVIRGSNLASFWARHGKPDVCKDEPKIVVCR